MIIYKTTNLINNKIYIGKTTRKSLLYYGSGIVLNQSIKKYGKENFKREIIEQCDTFEQLNERERFWILELKSYDPNIGYNRSYGGDGFSGITPETILKLKLKRSKRIISEETKQKIGDSNRNKPKSEQHKKSLSKSWEKRKIEKPHTKETLDKMSKSMIGKNVGKYIKIYEFKDSDGVIHQSNEGLVKFAKSKHKQIDIFRQLVKGILKEYHGWTYVKTIKE